MIKKLLIAIFFIILVACDNPNQQKEASKSFTSSKDLFLADYIAAADSMAVFSCGYPEPTFASRLKKDFDEFAEALTFKEKQECHGICWDKQWPAYYVELYRNGTPIDTTKIYATVSKQGFKKNGYNYYLADTSKVKVFFESRKIQKLPWGCRQMHWPKEDCGITCRSIEISDMQLQDSTGQTLSDSVYQEFAERVKQKLLFFYAQFSVQQKIHLDLDCEIEMALNNLFVSNISVKATPKIDSFEKHITNDWEIICDECSKEMRSIKFKMKFRDPLSAMN